MSLSELEALVSRAAPASSQRLTSAGGSTANAARGLAGLGARVRLAGAAGGDEWGGTFVRAVEASGADARLVTRVPGLPTARCAVLSVEGSSQRTMRTCAEGAARVGVADGEAMVAKGLADCSKLRGESIKADRSEDETTRAALDVPSAGERTLCANGSPRIYEEKGSSVSQRLSSTEGLASVAPPAPIFVTSAYTLYTPSLLPAVLTRAKALGARTALDLGSFECVRTHWPALRDALERSLVDTVLANEDEAATVARLLGETDEEPHVEEEEEEEEAKRTHEEPNESPSMSPSPSPSPPLDLRSLLPAAARRGGAALARLCAVAVVTAGEKGCAAFVRRAPNGPGAVSPTSSISPTPPAEPLSDGTSTTPPTASSSSSSASAPTASTPCGSPAPFVVYTCPALQSIVAVDPTGAGDLFDAGFLYARALGASVPQALRAGCLAGAAVVQVEGASLDERGWTWLRQRMQREKNSWNASVECS